MSDRVKYPNRTVYFGLQTGLLDAGAYTEMVERERLVRLRFYIDGCMVITTVEDFKEEFNIA